MSRDRGKQTERTVKGDPTVLKVYIALDKVGIKGMMAIEAVTQLQLDGVVFRDRELNPDHTECNCGGCVLDRRELNELPTIPESLCGFQGCVYWKEHEGAHTWEK